LRSLDEKDDDDDDDDDDELIIIIIIIIILDVLCQLEVLRPPDVTDPSKRLYR
jgi:hypothetical protein